MNTFISIHRIFIRVAFASLVVCLFSAEVVAQLPEYDCLSLQAESEVIIEGKANIGGFKCRSQPLQADKPIPSCFEKSFDGIRITNVQFDIPINDFDCGNPLILSDLKTVLESDNHPAIKFELNELVVRLVNPSMYRGKVHATTTVRGVQRDIDMPVEVTELAPKRYQISGKTSIKLSWYGIEQPSRFFGLLVLEDEVDVGFELYFTKSK